MPGRNPRRAYNADGREFAPMTLANMREHGTQAVDAECQACRHTASIKVDSLTADLPVPDVALRLKCSVCGSKNIVTRPDWSGVEHEAAWIEPARLWPGAR